MKAIPPSIQVRSPRGFTLIELLTVIAIIAVLAAIVIPVTGKARKVAQLASTVSSLRQIGVSINLYANDNKGRLPGPLTWGIFPWYRDPLPPTEMAHLFNFLYTYYNLPQTPSGTRVTPDVFGSPAVSAAARKSAKTANYVRRNGIGSTAPEDRPWGADVAAQGGRPFLTIEDARSSPNQPPRIDALTDKALRTAIITTADKESWVSSDNGLLPDEGFYSGKRVFLFIDGSVSPPLKKIDYTR